jgi:hypothetical protein
MRFCTKQHQFYCGIDLHARTIVVGLDVSSAGGAVRKNVGATFQCWPCSVRTV